MAKHTQALKRHRQSIVRQGRNYSYRSRLRTLIKRARTGMGEKPDEAVDHLKIACRELDRMVTKGILHKNNASRRKSRLTRAYNRAKAGTKID